jgi:hypothetical protein
VIVLRRVPLAGEGWQTFQAPFFYLLAAPPYLAIARIASSRPRCSRCALVLACALGLVEMVSARAPPSRPRRPPGDRDRRRRLPPHDVVRVALRQQRAAGGAAGGRRRGIRLLAAPAPAATARASCSASCSGSPCLRR